MYITVYNVPYILHKIEEETLKKVGKKNNIKTLGERLRSIMNTEIYQILKEENTVRFRLLLPKG